MEKGSTKSVTLLIVLFLLVALAASYIYAITSRPQLDEQARQSAPGRYVQLSKGFVHYELSGPESGQVVVLVHGLATPYIIWDNIFPELVKAGFRVLRYDLYGRGFSDRPEVVYDRDLYDQQLLELLQALNIEAPVYLVGESMGGAVATIFADRHPDKVSRLALFAPAGFPIEESWEIQLAKLPLLGDYLMAVFGDRFVLAGVKECFVNPGNLFQYEQKFKVQLKYTGFQRAILSTIRHMNMNSLADTYYRVGKLGKPVLLLWGDKDRVLPFANSDKVKEAIPQVEFHKIAGAGHNFDYEFPDIVNPILLRFLL